MQKESHWEQNYLKEVFKIPSFFHYLRRKDGIVQAYKISKKSFKNYVQLPRRRVYERKFGKRVRVYEKRALLPEVWRLAMGLKVPWQKQRGKETPHHKFMLFAWFNSEKEADDWRDTAEEKLSDYAAETVNWDWCGDFYDIDSGVQEILASDKAHYKPDLVGSYEIRHEDIDGRYIESVQGVI